MARARSGGSPSAAWAITLLGAGFFICGILAALFFAQKGGVEEELATAVEERDELASSVQRNSPEVQEAQTAEARQETQQQTVVGVLLARADAARNQLAAANQELDATNTELANTKQQLQISQTDLVEARQQQEAATQGLDQARQTFKDQAAALTAKVDAAEKANARLQEDLDNALALLRGDQEEMRREMQQTIDEMRLANDELERQLDAAESRIAELTASRDEQLAKIARPDATVVSLVEQGSKVYLDIGRNQKLSLGTTFSVYNGDQLLRLQEDQNLEPKAVIEVFELFDNSATARVVERQLNRRVQVGDAAVNLVFDPERTFKFFVFGDFDIDGDGNTAPNDLERVEARIRQWDSVVADEIDYDVDYLVLGIRPALPRELTGAERSDPIRIQEYNAALRKFNTFNDLLTQAQEYNIPVLNLNDFLDLTGYYER